MTPLLHRRTLLILACGLQAPAGAQRDPFEWLNQLQEAGENLLGAPRDPEGIRKESVQRLLRLFDGFLQAPAEFARRLSAECGAIPDGPLHALLFPALACASLAFSGTMPREAAAQRVGLLLGLAIPAAAQALKTPRGDLLALKDTQKHASILALLNWALASLERLNPAKPHARLHDHLTGLLRAALRASAGGLLESRPGVWRPADTLMALLSLSLWDESRGRKDASALVDAHLAWRTRTLLDPDTQLPRAGKGLPSRGSDLALQTCLLAHLNPKEARTLYARFAAVHWKDATVMAGFTEWPRGRPGPDMDDPESEAVLHEIGAFASGFGLGASLAMADAPRRDRLLGQLKSLRPIVRTALAGQTAQANPGADGPMPDDRYLTTFLYGDALVFYALAWAPWPRMASR